jgi:hypothetical protein
MHKLPEKLVNTMKPDEALTTGSVIRLDIEADEQKSERLN